MEKLSLQDVNKGEGFSSYELREALKDKIKEGDYIVNFAYTDYGGSFFDKVFIQYFKENFPDNTISENTCYYGENCFIWGDIAKEFWEVYEKYPLGFQDIEDYYYKMEYQQSEKDFSFFLNDIKRDFLFNFDKALDFLMENKQGYYNILPSGIDFSWDDLIKYLLKENIIFKEGEKLVYTFMNEGYSRDISEYYSLCFENGSIKDLSLSEKTLSIIREYQEGGKA